MKGRFGSRAARYAAVAAVVIGVGIIWGISPAASQGAGGNLSEYRKKESGAMAQKPGGRIETAILGGGCFWCVEAVYERIEGVTSAVSGYAGGTVPYPTYQQVIGGNTGHAEVVRIDYDADLISYEEILKIFWKAHDPTTLNRQGNDVGPQYRSIIITMDADQEARALHSREEAQKDSQRPIVTQIEPYSAFYVAEDYHQDYYENNASAGYCLFVIAPKLQKLGLDGQTF